MTGLSLAKPVDRILQERVWDWSTWNLFWLFRDRPDELDRLSGHLEPRRAISLDSMEPTALNCVAAAESLPQRIDFPPFDEEARATLERWLTLSALSLRPGLDALLETFEAALPDGLPSSEAALSELGVEGARPLRVRVSPPDSPNAVPQVVLLFEVGELPFTEAFERVFPIDPRARAWPCAVMTKTMEIPSVTKAIPEGPTDADYAAEFAAIRSIFQVLFEPPFRFCFRPGDTISYTAHCSASLPQLEAFYRAHDVEILRAADILKMSRAWTAVTCARQARLGDNRGRRRYPVLWSDEVTLSPADLQMPGEPTSFLSELQFAAPDLHDAFGIVLSRFERGGVADADVLAAAGLASRNWPDAGGWAFHLFSAARDRPEVQRALREAGFDRAHLLRLTKVIRSWARREKLPEPALELECAPLALPEGLPEEIADTLRATFPIEGDEIDVTLRDVAFSDEGELNARLSYHIYDDLRHKGSGQRPVVVMTSDELHDGDSTARLKNLLKGWAALSHEGLLDLVQSWLDPFRPKPDAAPVPVAMEHAADRINERFADIGLRLELSPLSQDMVHARLIVEDAPGVVRCIKEQDIERREETIDEARMNALLDSVERQDGFPDTTMPCDLFDWEIREKNVTPMSRDDHLERFADILDGDTDIARLFAKPADETTIASFLSDMELALPPEFSAFFRLCDGSTNCHALYDAEYVTPDDGLVLLSLEEIRRWKAFWDELATEYDETAASADEFKTAPHNGVLWHRSWLPLGLSVVDDVYALTTEACFGGPPHQVVHFNTKDWPQWTIVSESMADFIGLVVDLLEAKAKAFDTQTLARFNPRARRAVMPNGSERAHRFEQYAFPLNVIAQPPRGENASTSLPSLKTVVERLAESRGRKPDVVLDELRKEFLDRLRGEFPDLYVEVFSDDQSYHLDLYLIAETVEHVERAGREVSLEIARDILPDAHIGDELMVLLFGQGQASKDIPASLVNEAVAGLSERFREIYIEVIERTSRL